MENVNNRVDIKIIIVGNNTVGKTSLMQRFVHNKFDEGRTFPTIGAAFAAKEVCSNGRKRIIGIWDTAGTERYRAMAKMFYRDAKAAIVCYDITNRDSWDGLRSWITELREAEERCKVFICGTKKDLIEDGIAERDVPEDKTNEYARGIQVKMFETSSKTGENVEELFQEIIDACIANEFNNEKDGAIQLHNIKSNKACCYLT